MRRKKTASLGWNDWFALLNLYDKMQYHANLKQKMVALYVYRGSGGEKS